MFKTEEKDVQQLLQEKGELLEVLGRAPGQKAEGVTRIVYENLNGLLALLSGNFKLDKLNEIINDLEVDIFGFNEHWINLKHKDNRKHSISQLFNGGKSLVKGILNHNKHKKIDKYVRKRTQEGDTGMVAFGEMACWMHRSGSGSDETGLARWTYIKFIGKKGIWQ